MAKDVSAETIMPMAKLKPLLARAKKTPVSAAIGLTNGGEAVMLLGGRGRPKKVMAMLKTGAAKSKIALNQSTLRFGRASVNPADDATMVRFSINKPAPDSTRLKLVELIRRASFQKVEFIVDAALEDEPEDGDEEEGEDAVADAGDPVAAGADGAGEAEPSVPPAETPATAPPPTEPAGEAAVQPDGATGAAEDAQLRKALTVMAQRIEKAAAGDAQRKASMLALAASANAQIKAGQGKEAAAGLRALRELLETAAREASAKALAAAAGADAARRWAKARAVWQQASGTVDAQIGELRTALLATGDDDLEQIADFGLNAVMGGRKVSLMAALAEIGDGSPRTMATNGPKALAQVQSFRRHIESDDQVAALDDAPEKPTRIRETLGPALAELEAALTPA